MLFTFEDIFLIDNGRRQLFCRVFVAFVVFV